MVIDEVEEEEEEEDEEEKEEEEEQEEEEEGKFLTALHLWLHQREIVAGGSRVF